MEVRIILRWDRIRVVHERSGKVLPWVAIEDVRDQITMEALGGPLDRALVTDKEECT